MEENTGWRHYLRLVLNILIPFMGWVFLCLLGPKLLRFFMPFVIGWIIALIANPPVRFLERRLKLVRKHSSILIVVLVLAMVIGLLYLLFSRTAAGISALFKTLPQLYTALEADVKKMCIRDRPPGCGCASQAFFHVPDRNPAASSDPRSSIPAFLSLSATARWRTRRIRSAPPP